MKMTYSDPAYRCLDSGIIRPHRQYGTALVVGLVILLLSALIGISGIRTVVIEKNMASNSQYQMLVFQASESAIEGTLGDDSAFVAAINTPIDADPPTRTFSMNHGAYGFTITSNATISAGEPTVPIGYTIGDFVNYPFTITSEGRIASINALDTHIQTASKIAPFIY